MAILAKPMTFCVPFVRREKVCRLQQARIRLRSGGSHGALQTIYNVLPRAGGALETCGGVGWGNEVAVVEHHFELTCKNWRTGSGSQNVRGPAKSAFLELAPHGRQVPDSSHRAFVGR